MTDTRGTSIVGGVIPGIPQQSGRGFGKLTFGFPSSSDANAARSVAIASFLSALAIVASLGNTTSFVRRDYRSRHCFSASPKAAYPQNCFHTEQTRRKFNAMRCFGRCKHKVLVSPPLVVDSSKVEGSSATTKS